MGILEGKIALVTGASRGIGRATASALANLATPEAASQLAEKVRVLSGGRLDIVVANAGISKAGRMEDHTVVEFDHLFATNVRAPFFLVQQLLPLLGTGSSIVVTTSLAARKRSFAHS